MAKKHYELTGNPKKSASKVSKTFAQAGAQFKKSSSSLQLQKKVKIGLPLSDSPAMKNISKSLSTSSIRKKGWKKPGKRGIMGL